METRVELSEQVVRDYLTENVDYSLDAENLQGLRLFFRYATELKVLPAAPEIKFM